ncbi:hypothetical protein VTL71DRAFT_5682 [Oculimacula yallundae]|uniref:Xylanolytic transcriptional activator regulatory domain-containing protein n=1 Tax=Oculimacula yallundae TaxID=86028 RepID=A0ABR4BY68_9HELO
MCRYAASNLPPKNRLPGTLHHSSHSPSELKETQFEDGNPEFEDSVEETDSPLIVVEKGLGNLEVRDRPTSIPASGSDMQRTRAEVLKLFPLRHKVDFLIQHFIDKLNWTYEYINPRTFLERYGAWWSQPSYDGADDILFGALILRLCVFSLQHLPNSDYPTEGVLEESIEAMESRCDEMATYFDSYQPRPPSVIRVQYMILRAVTLLTSGDPKESYEALHEATKEAHAIDLFIEERWPSLQNTEAETRRKVFWLLFIWDRFFSSYYGRWPLIPHDYSTVQLPSSLPYTTSLDPTIPTPITDTILSIKTYQFMLPFISAPARKHERLDPFKVASHIASYKTEILDKFPPALRLENPDTSYDTEIENLDLKRIKLHALSWGVVEGMLRCFTGPMNLKSLQALSASTDKARVKLAEEHRHTLADACFRTVSLMLELHERMGGGQTRFWAIPAAMIENGGVLGCCLVSDGVIRRHWKKDGGTFRVFEEEILVKYVETLERAVKLLELLAQRSPLAKGGLALLRKSLGKIKVDVSAKDGTVGDCCSGNATVLETPHMNEHDPYMYAGYEDDPGAYSYGMLELDPVLAEWDMTAMNPSLSWYQENEMYDFGTYLGDGLPDSLQE